MKAIVKILLVVMMSLLPLTIIAQGAGGQIRRSAKKQAAISVPAKKKHKTKKQSSENQSVLQQEVTLEEAAGYDVIISCNVPTASFYIDGMANGTANGTRFLKTGTHIVKLEASGYEPMSQSIIVNSVSNSFSFTLKEEESKQSSILQRLVSNMVQVDGGTFTMGATSEQEKDADICEKPAHQVTISSFYIGKYEVTQEEWQAVMGNNPSYFKGNNLPVENVSWNDCQEFICKLNAITGKKFRLPTEAEWEFAARGGSRMSRFKYAGNNKIDHVAWYIGNSSLRTHDVGLLSSNVLGLYDMSGNVWEWCNDWYELYGLVPQINPIGPSFGTNHVFRGGAWNLIEWSSRVSNRNHNSSDYRGRNLGLRLAL